MRRTVNRRIIWATCICAICAFPCAVAAQPAPPSPAELIQRAIAAGKAQSDKNWKYTFREDHADYQLDKNGKAGPPATKTYDHIMLEGEEYKKLIAIEGKPLDTKTQKKVDEDMEKTRQVRRSHRLLSATRTVSVSDLDQLAVLFDNKVTGEDTVLGRRTWRMESEPKSGYRPANKHEEEVLAARHVSWFDQEEGVRIQWRDEFLRAANDFQPGSFINWEFIKIGEAWLPENVVMKADIRFAPGIHARVEGHQHFYDYKRFTAESTMTPQ